MVMRHKRISVIPAAAVACAIGLLLAACGRVDLERTGLVKLSNNVYAYIAKGPTAAEGLGANSGFVVGENGVLVVDTRYTPLLAHELLDAIRSVTDAPVRYVVNTHYHPDHTWGNSVFKDEGAVIFSRPETRASIEFYSPYYLDHYRRYRKDAYELIKDVTVVLPDSTFDDRLAVDLGGVEVVLDYFGPGHTAGDCVVTVPQDRIVFTGGLAANGYHLNLGDEGVDIDNWSATLIRLSAMDFKYVVPSQGFVSGPEVLDRCRSYIETLRSQCREEIRAGNYVKVVAMTMKVPGTEGFLQENLLPFNIQTVYRHEIMGVLRPNFAFDLPKGFVLDDGGAEGQGGRITWVEESGEGRLEIEVHWNPSAPRELLAQDVRDRVDRYVEANKNVLSMEVKGSKKLLIGGVEAPAAFGTFTIGAGTPQMRTGIWTWCMFLRDGYLYAIQLSADRSEVEGREWVNIRKLEDIAATFRRAAG